MRTFARFATAILVLFALPAAAQPTLDAVKKRGQLLCGVNGQAPGFSFQAGGKWSGFDVDYCRAIAAAVLGDANKVQYVPVNAQERFDRLAKGDFDVLARNSTVNLQRSVGTKVRAAAINYVDGQAFVVPKSAGIKGATELANRLICVVKGTDHQSNMALWFKLRSVPFLVHVSETPAQLYEAFFAGKCQALTQDASALAGAMVATGRAAEFMMLPDIISKEPLGLYVRAGDDAWLDVVRWTHYALIEAEEREITSANVEDMKRAVDINVQRFVGVVHGNGKTLGLDEAWAMNVIKQVGNYSEIFERNLGQESPLKFARGSNALWTKAGGMMFSPPFH